MTEVDTERMEEMILRIREELKKKRYVNAGNLRPLFDYWDQKCGRKPESRYNPSQRYKNNAGFCKG